MIFAVILIMGSAALSSYAETKGKDKVKYKRVKGGLKNMIEISESRDYMVRELNIETENYLKIKKGVDSEKLVKGETSEEVRKKYGAPVIKLEEKEGQRWVYKPAAESFSTKDKIYLVFDNDGKLISREDLSENEHQDL